MTSSPPLVVHVLPLDIPRGAQRYARAMRDALDGPDCRHRVMTLFSSDCDELRADIKLNLPQGKSARLGLDPAALLALNRKLRELAPLCVVAHGSQPLKYLTLAAPIRLPVIAYRLGIAHAAAHRPPQRAFHTLLYRRAIRVAGVSRECLDEAAELFFTPRERLVLIPNGRDPTLFHPSDSASPTPTLMFLGHLSSTKRPDLFLDVVSELRSRGSVFNAQMVGDGPMEATLAPRAHELAVEMLGRRDDVPALLRRASVLAFTSIPDGEGMPGVFIEAGLSGVPVVSTAVPGASTVLDDGVTGHVVGVGDRAGMVERCAELLENPARRAELGHAARLRCADEFSLERSVARWRQLLLELFPGAAATGRDVDSFGHASYPQGLTRHQARQR